MSHNVATKTVGFGSLPVAECRDAVCVGCTFVVIVVLHRRSACWSFSLKILEAGKARLRREQMMTLVASCERHVRSATIDVGASIASTNTAIVNFTAKAENAASKRRRTSANLRLSVRTYLRANNSSWIVSRSIPIATGRVMACKLPLTMQITCLQRHQVRGYCPVRVKFWLQLGRHA